MKMGAAPNRREEPNAIDKSSIFIDILEKCKNGATKRDLIATIPLFSLSNAQFRRSTAELVDRRLLHYDDERQHVFITTDKGILFLNRVKKTSNITYINKFGDGNWIFALESCASYLLYLI
jgi:predicted transcriptional regulator